MYRIAVMSRCSVSDIYAVIDTKRIYNERVQRFKKINIKIKTVISTAAHPLRKAFGGGAIYISIKSFIISPAIISPAQDGTNEILAGVLPPSIL